jgi:hypothetical protein
VINCLGTLFVAAPFFVVAGNQVFHTGSINTLFTINLVLLELYPLLVNLILIGYVTPYRDGVLQLMTKIGCVCLERKDVNVTVFSQTSG